MTLNSINCVGRYIYVNNIDSLKRFPIFIVTYCCTPYLYVLLITLCHLLFFQIAGKHGPVYEAYYRLVSYERLFASCHLLVLLCIITCKLEGSTMEKSRCIANRGKRNKDQVSNICQSLIYTFH